jgi:hypothetical protein
METHTPVRPLPLGMPFLFSEEAAARAALIRASGMSLSR